VIRKSKKENTSHPRKEKEGGKIKKRQLIGGINGNLMAMSQGALKNYESRYVWNDYGRTLKKLVYC